MLTQARVDFKRPKHAEMESQGFTSVDMHYHTKYSDGTRKISAIAKKAKRLGIGVAITDHNEIRGALEISNNKDIFSIPGIETTSKEGIHTLHYFYNESELSEFYSRLVMPNKKKDCHFLEINFKDLFDYSRDYNSLIVAAHPYGVAWTGVCSGVHKNLITTKNVSDYDGIEVINAAALKYMNKNALNLAQSLNKGITGGSDGHRLFELGGVLTYLKYPCDRDCFLDSIKKNESFVKGREINMVEKIATHSTKLKVPVKHPIIYFKKGMGFTKSLIKGY